MKWPRRLGRFGAHPDAELVTLSRLRRRRPGALPWAVLPVMARRSATCWLSAARVSGLIRHGRVGLSDEQRRER